MILFSKQTKALAAKYGISVQDLIFADLIAANWDAPDAYYIAYQTGTELSAAAIARATREKCAIHGIKARIKELRKGVSPIEVDTSGCKSESKEERDKQLLQEALSKERMLIELRESQTKMQKGSKEWMEVNKLIAELGRMKHEEVKTEDNTVHFFLPATCDKCQLFLEHGNKNDKRS